MRFRTSLCASMLIAAGLATTSQAGSHLWRFNEIFSNEDGTIVFIEMKECCGANNEIFLANKDVSSSTMSFLFPANLPCSNCTADKHLLLATQAFADLPGAPTPDYIIPEGFLNTAGDTLTYWSYGAATWNFGVVPTDGVNSLALDGTVAVNSPTNFNDESGSVVVPCHPADTDGSGAVDVSDLLEVLGNWGPCDRPCAADVTGDLVVDVEDLLAVLGGWGPC